MSPPTVSTPLGALVFQIKKDLREGAALCREIKRSQRARSTLSELDRLEDALSSGSGFVEDRYQSVVALDPATVDGVDNDKGDDGLRQDLAGFERRLTKVNQHLKRWTYPENVHHEHMHDHDEEYTHHHHHDHHHHHRHWHLIHFLGLDVNHHHSHPHHHRDSSFHHLEEEWEDIHDGIFQAFEQFRDRVQNKKKVKDKEAAAVKKETVKWEDKLKEEKKKAHAEHKELVHEKQHQARLRRWREENEKKLADALYTMGEKKLADDPAREMAKLADVMGDIQRNVVPRYPAVMARAEANSKSSSDSHSYYPWSYPPPYPPVSYYGSCACSSCYFGGSQNRHKRRSVSVPATKSRGFAPISINVRNGNVVHPEAEVEEILSTDGGHSERRTSHVSIGPHLITHHNGRNLSPSSDSSFTDEEVIGNHGHRARLIHHHHERGAHLPHVHNDHETRGRERIRIFRDGH